MSIYFALEYDENGVSRIVEKKDTSTRAITQRDFNLGTYVGNQITSPEDPNQPDEGDTTGDFISQMGTGTMANTDGEDSFSRFIDRGNLTAFMDKGGKDTKFVNAIFAALGIPVTAEGLTKFFDSIAKMLPQESKEVKAIRTFYANEGLTYMDPTSENYIPGMENYNIISGGIKNPTAGLAAAYQSRLDTIDKTLNKWEKLAAQGILEFQNKLKNTTLYDRRKLIQEAMAAEEDFKNEFEGDDKIDVTAPGAGTVITPDTDEEVGRPDDPRGPSGPPSTGFTAPTKQGQSPRGTTVRGGGQDAAGFSAPSKQGQSPRGSRSAPTNVGNPFGR